MIKITISRKKITVATLLTAVLITISFQGCLGGSSGPASREVVSNSVEKMKSVQSYKATGEMTLRVVKGKETKETTGSYTTYVSGDNQRKDISVEPLQETSGMTSSGRIYQLSKKVYSCTKKSGSWTCKKPPDSALSQAGGIKENKIMDLVDKGVINFKNQNAQKREIAGRTCNYVKMNLDLQKAASMENTSLPSQAAQSNMNINVNQCFDEETGIPLLTETNINIARQGQTGSISIKTRLNSLQVGKNIPNSIFELPAEAETMEMPENMTKG